MGVNVGLAANRWLLTHAEDRGRSLLHNSLTGDGLYPLAATLVAALSNSVRASSLPLPRISGGTTSGVYHSPLDLPDFRD